VFAARLERPLASNAGEPLEDEVAIARVKGRCVEPESTPRALEAELDCLSLLDLQVGIADLECTAGVMQALGEQLGDIGRAFGVLARETRHDAEGQFVEHAKARTLRRK